MSRHATRFAAGRAVGLLGLCILILAPACSRDGAAPLLCTVTALSVSPPTGNLFVGGQLTLVATLSHANCGSEPQVIWTTGAPSIAIVQGSGTSATVTPLLSGVAVITATVVTPANSMQASATITVDVNPVVSVTVHAPFTTLTAGQSVQLIGEPRDGTGAILNNRPVTWTSSNDGVISVTPAGLIQAHAVGVAQITATSEGKSGSVIINVILPVVSSVTVLPEFTTLLPGQNAQLTATPRDLSGNPLAGFMFNWVSSNDAVVTVTPQGFLSALTAGTATITATTSGVSGVAQVTVNAGGDPGRFAWATVENGATSVVSRFFNGKGGAVTSARIAAGQYSVTFAGLGDPFGARTETSETVIVSAYRTAQRHCGIEDWNDAGTNLVVGVICTDATGAFADGDFNILVAGKGSLANPSVLLRANSLAPLYTPDPRWAWNTTDAPMQISAQGSFRLVDHGITSGTAAGFAVTPTLAGTAGVCALFGLTQDSNFASVRCFAPSGLIQDRLFTFLMLRGGRASKPDARYGFARVENPSASQSQLSAPQAGSSSGGTIVADRLTQGRWRVRFPGLAGPGGALAEAAFVTPMGQPYAACHVESWGVAGPDLEVLVRCHNAAGGAVDHQFSLIVVE
jgi:uncharacterized protein YjdB